MNRAREESTKKFISLHAIDDLNSFIIFTKSRARARAQRVARTTFEMVAIPLRDLGDEFRMVSWCEVYRCLRSSYIVHS
jgi:hypothetical protein